MRVRPVREPKASRGGNGQCNAQRAKSAETRGRPAVSQKREVELETLGCLPHADDLPRKRFL